LYHQSASYHTIDLHIQNGRELDRGEREELTKEETEGNTSVPNAYFTCDRYEIKMPAWKPASMTSVSHDFHKSLTLNARIIPEIRP
jgi:hypothetical protein